MNARFPTSLCCLCRYFDARTMIFIKEISYRFEAAISAPPAARPRPGDKTGRKKGAGEEFDTSDVHLIQRKIKDSARN